MPFTHKLILLATLSTLVTGAVAMEKNQKIQNNLQNNPDEIRSTLDDLSLIHI